MTDYAVALDGTRDIQTGIADAMLTTGIDPYCQDDGEASWSKPLGRVNWAVPAAIPLHSWAATALFGTAPAWRGAAMASQALALATTQLLSSPETVSRASAELAARVTGGRSTPAQAGEVAPVRPGLWTSDWLPDINAGGPADHQCAGAGHRRAAPTDGPEIAARQRVPGCVVTGFSGMWAAMPGCRRGCGAGPSRMRFPGRGPARARRTG